MKISSSLFYFQDKHFCLQCNGRLFQIEKRAEMGHTLKVGLDRIKHRILITPEMELNLHLKF